MGFLTGNKTEEERIQEEKNKILTEGQVLIDLAVGTHGADEVVAGAMMGETGKYLAMAKYGKTKWQSTHLLIFNEGVQIYCTGLLVYYNEIRSIEVTNKGWLDTEFILHTFKGPFKFKLFGVTFKALRLIISELKEKYLEQLEQEKINQQQKDLKEKSDEKIDKLLQLGEMHEKGLLSDEEFNSMKQDLLDGNEDTMNQNYTITNTHENINGNILCHNDTLINDKEYSDNTKFCIYCGAEIFKDSNFCTECGKPVK